MNSHFMTLILTLVLMAACGPNKDGHNYPKNFASLPTDRKMEYIVDNHSPQEVAQIVCEAVMGESDAGNIDLPQARDYVYSHYNTEQIITFETECEAFADSLPLADKVKFARKSATEDMEHYAYELGLAYVGSIREKGKSVDDVEQEIKELGAECKGDPDFYRRFMKGFKAVLENDRGRDLDEKIYLHFISYPDNIK